MPAFRWKNGPPIWAVVGAAVVVLAALVLVVEHITQAPSFLRGAVFPCLALCWGGGYLRLAGAPQGDVRMALAVGTACLSLAFAACVLAQVQWAFLPVAVAAAIVGALGQRRTALRRRVPWWSVGLAVLVVAGALRVAYFVDRLPFDGSQPRAFAWIDTPFWLTIAYGVERALPAPDLLVQGAHLNYHVGAGVLVAAVRRVTGVGMPGAHLFTAVYLTALSASLLHALARRQRLLPRGPLSALIALALAFVLSAYVSWNLPTLAALPLLLSTLMLLRVTSPLRRALCLAPLALLLALTKEVHFVFALFFMLASAAPHIRRDRRHLAQWIAPVVFLAAGQLAQRTLLRPEQSAHLGLFQERLDWTALRAELQREHGFIYTVPGSSAQWLLIALGFSLWAARSLRGVRRDAVLLAASSYGLGFALSLVVKPWFSPPMDAFSYKWLLFDMEQFEKAARLLLAATLALLGLGSLARGTSRDLGPKLAMGAGPCLARSTLRDLGPKLAMGAGLLLLHVVYTWQSLPVGPAREHPEERGDDDIAEVLAQIPTRGSLLAADQFNWNGENPHWAAYFGHQFLALRKGRWTASLPAHERVLSDQATLFLSEDAAVGMRTARALGVTHIIVPRERGIPWLRAVEPHLGSPRWAVYEIARLP